ncbi:MAG: pectin acetylesterase-family hydrolase [Acidobacteria bacterium]|nr:pectin acetylesterase-family hydrolase [Acidobacteriota bacterium]MCY3932660.1 pectin acetylesterase-family hydrolase [Acidobacteriota bacterium]
MKNRHSAIGIVTTATLALAALACAPAEEAPEPVDLEAPLADLTEGWNTITPGGSTTCSDGSPFRFFVRAADPTQLVFYLQGGGGCWNAQTCDPQGNPTYTMTAVEELPAPSTDESGEEPAYGISAFNHPENPFADHSFVFVPYCTGDVHIGDRDAVYEAAATDDAPAREFTIHHRGYTNGRAALDWTYEHFLGPETVFVTGSSAGSIPSPVYARHFAENYPAARVTALGDGAGGYRNLTDSRPHESWGTLAALSHFENMNDVVSENFSFETLYIKAAKAHPDVMFARYDTAEDDVQLQFLRIAGTNVDDGLQPLLDANEADIDAALEGQDNYRSYVAPGELHTIMLNPAFYTYETDGVRVRDWVASLAAGEPVDDVHCGDCTGSPVPEAAEGGEATGP